ncbi:MAG: hypothetical protein GX595_05155, partial [Lentisphaerae bacterium]|nr:hypothetical protein [Lentisphaerota bacterium]
CLGRERGSGGAWALSTGRRLQTLRQELADGGLDLAAVAARGDDIEEAERWQALAELEGLFLEHLQAMGLQDACTARIAMAHAGDLPESLRHVVLAAVPDPPRLFITLLERWAERGGRVDVLIAAPAADAAAFDDWGRPRPPDWHPRRIDLDDDQIGLEAKPEDQAARLAEAIREAWKAGRTPQRLRLAIGVPDRETVAPLQRHLASLGLPAFDPQNRRFAETPLCGLVEALLALRRNPGYNEAAALLRHPHVLPAGKAGAAVLRELDALQPMALPVTLGDLRDALSRPRRGTDSPAAAWPHLRAALDRLEHWRRILERGLAAGLREALQDVYAERRLDPGCAADAAFQESAEALDGVLRELEAAGPGGAATVDDAEVLAARLRDALIPSVRRGEVVDLEGWLELPWNPAPVLMVAGLNEGLVPDGQISDAFLPNGLRQRLGLRDDDLRLARDAYILTALLEQRRAGGQAVFLVGRTSSRGDPLRPSRLLFRCPDEALVQRAALLFRDPPPTQSAAAFAVSFALDPARLPDGCVNRRCLERLSPTAFRDYLACPLRFYLKHVLGMEPVDDRAREPDAMAFGNLVHAVLNEMGQDRGLWGCGDSDRLGRWLAERLHSEVARLYGARHWLGVELAMDSATKRLRALAEQQVAWHDQGWRIVAVERTVEGRPWTDGPAIRGRVDRVDRNERTGEFCALDYKTSEKAQEPAQTHLGATRDPEMLPEAVVAAGLVALPGARPGRERRWSDLQLPLYRELLTDEFGPGVDLGYVCLPNALGETGFKLWEGYSDALHLAAMGCAKAIAQRLREGVFWPPGPSRGRRRDDLAGVLLDDPATAVRKPADPWRRATP